MKQTRPTAHPCTWGFCAKIDDKPTDLPLRGGCIPVEWRGVVEGGAPYLDGPMTEEREAELRDRVLAAHGRRGAGSVMRQIALCADVREGDRVVWHNARGGTVAFGRVTGEAWTYAEGEPLPLRRAVEWVAEVPKGALADRKYAMRIAPACTIRRVTGEAERAAIEAINSKAGGTDGRTAE